MDTDPLEIRFGPPSGWPTCADVERPAHNALRPFSLTVRFGSEFTDIALAPGPPEVAGQEAITAHFPDGQDIPAHTVATDGRLGRMLYGDCDAPR